MKHPRESLEMLQMSFKDRKKSFGIVKSFKIAKKVETSKIGSQKILQKDNQSRRIKNGSKILKNPRKTKRILRNVLKNL